MPTTSRSLKYECFDILQRIAPDSIGGLILSIIRSFERPASINSVFLMVGGRYVRTAAAFQQVADRS